MWGEMIPTSHPEPTCSACTTIQPHNGNTHTHGDGFYGSNDPTNSVKALKEVAVLRIRLPDMTYNVFSGTLNPTQSINHTHTLCADSPNVLWPLYRYRLASNPGYNYYFFSGMHH